MFCIFFREDDLVCRYLPIDSEVRVVPCDCTFALRSVEVVAFVLENNFICQYYEAMGEASRNEELTVIILSEFDSYMQAECRRAFTDIDCDIKNSSLDNAYELALSVRRLLEMKASENSVA